MYFIHVFLALSLVLFISSVPSIARNSHRYLDGKIYNHRRTLHALNNNTAHQSGEDDVLRKRDDTKYVFMHHVSYFFISN